MMTRSLLSTVFAVASLAIAAPAEAPYLRPPVYERSAYLADIWSAAELVVLGMSGERKIEVERVLFGRSPDLTAGGRTVLLEARPHIQSWERGVWFLVRGPNGYVPLNPDGKVVSLKAFREIPKPTRHWTEQPNLVANRPTDVQVYYTYAKAGVKGGVWHGTNVFCWSDGDVSVELKSHSERELWLSIGATGSLKRMARWPAEGHGFSLERHEGRIIEFCHYRNRKLHGLRRRYFREPPHRLREEKHYTDGVVDGRWRAWNRKGEVTRDETYERGLIPPIVRYEGEGTNGVRLYRTQDGASYSSTAAVMQVKVGMTTQEVSQLLKVDFSPTQGVLIPCFTIDTYLHIRFKDGKVNKINSGHNGVCVRLRLP